MAEYDGIVLGAGHNGLILQAYAARAGLSVLSIDRNNTTGGGLATIEYPVNSGFMHNTHAFFLRAVAQMPWYNDLELGRHGAAFMEPELNVALILRDGRALQWWTDFDRTEASFARFNERDAATLKRWHDDFRPIVDHILIPEALSPPLPASQRKQLLQRSPEGRLLLKVSELSPLEFVLKEFENPVVQAGLLFFNGLREVDLRLPGFGHHIAALLASPAKAQMCIGGSRNLAKALAASAASFGGTFATSSTPAKILIEGGRATGVKMDSGELHHARHFVASSLNPQQTFLELLDQSDLPASWRTSAENFSYNLLAPLFALNLNLTEPPAYSAAEIDPELNKAFMVILGLEHVEQFDDIVRHHEAGTIPPTVMWGACPTVFDSTQAPDSKHTAFMWEKLPYHLHGNASEWDSVKEKHGRDMLKVWSQYAPELYGQVSDSFTRSALDVERSLPNMRYGDLLVGAFSNDQIGDNRPFPGAGQYRGHIPGLYLCGSSSHPGGNITGLPGYNAAQVLLSDVGLATDWAPPSVAERLAAL